MGENPVYSAILSRYDVGAPTGITISLPGAESQVFTRLTQRDHSSLMTSGVFFYHNNCFPIFYTINHGHISPLILPIYGRRDGRHPSAYLSPCTLTNIENTFLGCREEKADCTAGSLRFYRLNNSLTEISWSFLRAAVQGRGGREPVAKLGWGEGGGRQSCHCFSWDWLCWLHWVRVKQVRYILVSAPHLTIRPLNEIILQRFHKFCLQSVTAGAASWDPGRGCGFQRLSSASRSFFLFYVKLVRLTAIISHFLIQWWRSSMGLLVIATDTVWFETVENKMICRQF